MYEDLIEEKVSSEDIFDGVLLHVKRDYVKLPMVIKLFVNG